MIAHGKEIKVFTANANVPFAKGICAELGLDLGDSTVTAFADGEVSVSINESVRGCDVFVVQSTCKPVNNNLMELLIMIDAFRRASAGASLRSFRTSAMPVRTARPRAATPSPPSWWRTSSPARALTAC